MDRNRNAQRRSEFAAALRALREAAGWSQEELGEQLARASKQVRPIPPVTRQTVFWWEAGRRWPDPYHGYLLCRLFRKAPEALVLDSIVTPRAVSRILGSVAVETDQKMINHLTSMTTPQEVLRPQVDTEVDWERLGFAMRSMASVDRRVVHDQWILTRQYLAGHRTACGRTLLELMVAHIARLRHLRTMTSDEGLRRELGIMLGQTFILAGQGWVGLTDFGLALAAYRSAALLAEEMREEWLRITGLLSQAQMSGIHAPAPWSASKRVSFLEETRTVASALTEPSVRVWVHATRAQLHTLVGQETEALRDLELADRAQAQLSWPDGHYFASVDSSYLLVQRASVALTFGRAIEAARLFHIAADGVSDDALPMRAWFIVNLGAALTEAGDFDRAIPTLIEALDLTRTTETPLLAVRAGQLASRVCLLGDHPRIDELQHKITAAETR